MREAARASSLAGEHTFDYDNLGRLTDAAHPAAGQWTNPDEAYAYDTMGNRASGVNSRPVWDTSIQGPEPPRIAYEYDAAYRLASDSVYNYSYDANGNCVSRARRDGGATWTYTYDSRDLLTGAALLSGASGTAIVAAAYKYDLMGRRIEKNVNGVVTRYAYEGHALVAQYDGASATPAARWHYAPGAIDGPIAMERGGRLYYYVYDERGSVTAITNEDGQVVQRYEYDSFGRMTLSEGAVSQPFTYTGREYDPETGLYYYRARSYDPDTGRFLQQDPVFSLNPYPYAGNDPVNFVDPLGLYQVQVEEELRLGKTGSFYGDLANTYKRIYVYVDMDEYKNCKKGEWDNCKKQKAKVDEIVNYYGNRVVYVSNMSTPSGGDNGPLIGQACPTLIIVKCGIMFLLCTGDSGEPGTGDPGKKPKDERPSLPPGLVPGTKQPSITTPPPKANLEPGPGDQNNQPKLPKPKKPGILWCSNVAAGAGGGVNGSVCWGCAGGKCGFVANAGAGPYVGGGGTATTGPMLAFVVDDIKDLAGKSSCWSGSAGALYVAGGGHCRGNKSSTLQIFGGGGGGFKLPKVGGTGTIEHGIVVTDDEIRNEIYNTIQTIENGIIDVTVHGHF